MSSLASDIHAKNPEEIKKELKRLQELLKKEPTRTDVLLEMSSCFRHLDNYEEALKVHEQLIKLHPENIEYKLMQGIVMFECGKFTEALPVFDELLTLDPDNRDALFNKALILKKLDRQQEANEYMKRALKRVEK